MQVVEVIACAYCDWWLPMTTFWNFEEWARQVWLQVHVFSFLAKLITQWPGDPRLNLIHLLLILDKPNIQEHSVEKPMAGQWQNNTFAEKNRHLVFPLPSSFTDHIENLVSSESASRRWIVNGKNVPIWKDRYVTTFSVQCYRYMLDQKPWKHLVCEYLCKPLRIGLLTSAALLWFRVTIYKDKEGQYSIHNGIAIFLLAPPPM